jgi:hypothetical protein
MPIAEPFKQKKLFDYTLRNTEILNIDGYRLLENDYSTRLFLVSFA